MALVFAEGFDAVGTSGTFDERKWYRTNLAANNEVVAGRIGGFACRCRDWLNTNALTAQTTYIVGCAFQPRGFGPLVPANSAFDNSQQVVGFNSDIFTHVFVTINGCLQLQAWRDGAGVSETLLGTGPSILKLSKWYYIEVKATANAGTSGSIEVRLGGATEISVSGIKTTSDDPLASGAAVSFDNFLWKGDSSTVTKTNLAPNTIISSTGVGNGPYVDDIYIADTTGGVNANFLGDIYVETLFPNGAGNTSAWTSSSATTNYLDVDEQPVNDDTDYVSTGTVNNVDTYTYDNLAVNTIVNGVQNVLVARHDDAGPHSLAPVTRPGVTDNVGVAQSTITTYLDYIEIADTNPDTASQWTAAEVNASEFGVKLIT